LTTPKIAPQAKRIFVGVPGILFKGKPAGGVLFKKRMLLVSTEGFTPTDCPNFVPSTEPDGVAWVEYDNSGSPEFCSLMQLRNPAA
jgi:hypothetical protein